VIDYLQLAPPPSGAARAALDEDVALVLRELKAFALARRVACLVVAQLPRFERSRPDRRPSLEDYGHLGSVKQHADVVLSLYREEMYTPGAGVEGATELIVSRTATARRGSWTSTSTGGGCGSRISSTPTADRSADRIALEHYAHQRVDRPGAAGIGTERHPERALTLLREDHDGAVGLPLVRAQLPPVGNEASRYQRATESGGAVVDSVTSAASVPLDT
jgi:hypothetical protein